MFSFFFVRLENKKTKKRKVSTEDASNSSSSDEEKKKKKSKHKKKEKHRRKKEAKLSGEEENQIEETKAVVNEKSNDISGRDIMGLKTTIDPSEIPEIPQHKFLMRKSLNETTNENANAR